MRTAFTPPSPTKDWLTTTPTLRLAHAPAPGYRTTPGPVASHSYASYHVTTPGYARLPPHYYQAYHPPLHQATTLTQATTPLLRHTTPPYHQATTPPPHLPTPAYHPNPTPGYHTQPQHTTGPNQLTRPPNQHTTSLHQVTTPCPRAPYPQVILRELQANLWNP
nr:extensin-3-like [Penaeus vannamei]